MVFSVQLLGAELLTRAINGEPMDSQAITDLFFAKAAVPATPAAAPTPAPASTPPATAS
jgi:voltage-gated potassium channel